LPQILNNPTLFIGLMSGTSLDGVDAALVDFQREDPVLKGFLTYPYPTSLRQQLDDLNQDPNLALSTLCQLEYEVANQFSQAACALLEVTQTQPSQVRAIGSHGQTIHHAPAIPMSLQIGHPAFIAKHTGICTVADFRVDDLAHQGQGAPLAPAFHRVLFQSSQPVVIINIGGIANLTYLDGQEVIGFDSGPGNGLMDSYCQTTLAQAYDKSGALAAKGQVIPELLSRWLSDPYFKKPAPKSTGKEYFNAIWLQKNTHNLTTYTVEDLLSTLAQLTVETLLMALTQLPKQPQAIWVCGGGAENQTLIQRLQKHLPYPVQSTQIQSINPHAIEAMMCAWLAKERLENRPIALTSITGANKNSILGGVWSPI